MLLHPEESFVLGSRICPPDCERSIKLSEVNNIVQ